MGRPFTIEELQKRMEHLKKSSNISNGKAIHQLEELEDNELSNNNNNSDDTDKLHQHERHLQGIVSLYNLNGPRKERRYKGKQVPEELRNPLLDILKSLRWQVPNDRKHLNAERYLVLPTNVTNDRF